MDIPGSKAVYVSLAILGLLAIPALLYAIPAVQSAVNALDLIPVLASEPYALDDPVKRSRVSDGSTGARFPAQIEFRPLDEGVVFASVSLDVDADAPGYNGELRVYKPAGAHAAGSLGCVLVGPAGGTQMSGPVAGGGADEEESLPYVKAGFAVVAFRQDGELPSHNPSNVERLRAGKDFLASQAGLVNARNALEFVLARMKDVDRKRIYVAGHSSAATLAILFAEHEHRLRGCIAYAPVADLSRLMAKALASQGKKGGKLSAGDRELFAKISPVTHARKLTCPVFLFHSRHDTSVPAQESYNLAARLKQLGKKVELVAVDGHDHHGDMIQEGIPTGIGWLEDLEHPELAEERKKERAESATARRAPNVRGGTAATTPDYNARLLANRCAAWVASAESASEELSQLVDDTSADLEAADLEAADLEAVVRVNSALIDLADKAAGVAGKAREMPASDKQGPIHTLPAATRDRLVALNRTLGEELARLRKLELPELRRGGTLVILGRSLLAESFLEGRPPTAEELEAQFKIEAEMQAASRKASKWVRNLRSDAEKALGWGYAQNGLALLRADVLVGDEQKLLKSVKWARGLKRPAAHLLWAFGAELKGFPGAGPENLRPPPRLPQKGTRGTNAEWRLGDQLKDLTGDIGLWLAEGLQSRVDAGGFGDWGQDSHRGWLEHPGIVLLDFAPVESLLASAKAQKADVLMAVLLTSKRSEGKPVTTMIVRVYDVERGEMLWESKSITNTRIVSSRRRGGSADAEFAEAVLELVDAEILLRDAGKPDEANVERRLEAIGAQAAADPLEALIELRYYQLSKAIGDDEARERIAQILGDKDAARLLSNDEDLRRQALGKLVPKDWNSPR